MLVEARRVYVIQHKATGLFLNADLELVRSLKEAGRAEDLQAAKDTAEAQFWVGECWIHSLLEEEYE